MGGIDFQGGYEAAGQLDYFKSGLKWGTNYLIQAHKEPNVFYAQVKVGNIPPIPIEYNVLKLVLSIQKTGLWSAVDVKYTRKIYNATLTNTIPIKTYSNISNWILGW
jgi:hypothetical protein